MKKTLISLFVISLFALSFLPAFSLRALNESYELVLNIPANKLLLFNRGAVIKEYTVGVGSSLTPTPLGDFKVVRRIHNPAWVNPYKQSKIISPH